MTCTDASLPPAGHAFLSRLQVDVAALVFPTLELLVRLILAASNKIIGWFYLTNIQAM